MKFFKNLNFLNVFLTLPYLALLLVFVVYRVDLVKSISLGLETVDNLYLIYIYIIFSLIFIISILFVTSGRVDLTVILFLIGSLLINSTMNSYALELIQVAAFIFGFLNISVFISEKLIKKSGTVEKLFISLILNYLILNICLFFEFPIGLYIKIFTIAGIALFLFKFGSQLKRNAISYPSLYQIRLRQFWFSWFDFLFLFCTVIISSYTLMLINQPIFEWDSSVGHLPTMNYYLESNSLTPNPYQIQSYFVNFHHISALPFFKLLGLRGLKFFNFLQVVILVFLIVQIILLLNREAKLNSEGRFVILGIVSVPVLICQIGTFQYDVSVTAILGFSFYFLIRLIRNDQENGHRLILLILLSIIMGVYSKVNYVSVAVPIVFVVCFLYFKYNFFTLRSFLIYLLISALSVGIIIGKSYYYTGTLFMPYSQILAHNSDWNEYGLTNANLFLKTIYFIIGYTFSDKYGGYYLYTGGFIYFLAYLSVVNRWQLEKIYLSVIVIFSIAVASLSTQYARYYIYFLSFLPLILIEKNMARFSFSFKIRHIILILCVFIQILLVPRMNWWTKLDGSSLFAGYDPDRHESMIRGQDYLDFQKLVSIVGNKKTLALLPDFAIRFYYISKERNTKIIPFTWQANIYHLFNDVNRIPSILKDEGFQYVFIPTKLEWNAKDPFFNYYSILDHELRLISETKNFRLYQVF